MNQFFHSSLVFVSFNPLDFFFLVLCSFSSDSVSCYRIDPAVIAGIIAADLVLTLIIVVLTYKCASSQRQKIDDGTETLPFFKKYISC
uniref:Uncharacterized protein n=1 Tax=Kryptolebias marmoratus TaxID=37003 RepID=A0A3Q3B199_KRYMA